MNITRIAPTPSGYLHEGNLVNFLLTQRLARSVDATIALRIDDIDAERFRIEYVDDIFRMLEWLGITWEVGPRDAVDFSERFSLRRRIDHYYERMQGLITAGLPTFVCQCSRRNLGSDLRCINNCLSEHHTLTAGKSSLRVRVPNGDPAAVMGDFVLWRRDGQPSYQLASLIEDEELGTTHIVRGEDLQDSTTVQLYLAGFITDSRFLRVEFLHHGLLRGPDGEKLSKSQGTARLQCTDALRHRLEAACASIA